MSNDSEICGAECLDGTQCQHPAGSCPVPSHSDPDAENPHGRKFSIDESDHDDILEAAQEGLSKSGCARAAGTSIDSLNRYLGAHDEFREAFMRAREAGERRLVRDGLRDPNTDSSMAKFLLSTSFDYIKTEKRELDAQHEHSGDLEVTSSVVEVTEDSTNE